MPLEQILQAEVWQTVVAHQRASEAGLFGLARCLEEHLDYLRCQMTQTTDGDLRS